MDLIIQAGIGSVVEACQILDVNRTAFYAWRSSDATTFQQNDEKLAPEIRDVFTKHRRRYGARRIASELQDRGHVCSPRRASRIMKTQGFRAIQRKSFVPKTTNSRHRLGYAANLLADADAPDRINQIWVADIT